MFGGWGISVDGVTMGIIADLTPQGTGNNERLYLKADDTSKTQFEAAGRERFVNHANGKDMGMNYYTVPDEAMESPDAMRHWARLALLCAMEAKAIAKPKVKKVAVKTASKTPAKKTAAKFIN